MSEANEVKLSPVQQRIIKRMREGIPLRYVHRRGEHYAWLNEPPTFWGGHRVRLPTFFALKRKGAIFTVDSQEIEK